ncbi:hypothetical protein PM082_010410 [Marasmius tenuissimus]|nr:hypothetical protein PM082_010410 [Marasmius tenuissimus]
MSSANTSFSERSSLLSSRSSGLKGLFRNTITSDDRHVISQFLLDAEKEMKECQAEINRLWSAMHLLENKRNGLKKTMEKCRSLLSPVHRLPAEVLAIIFSFCRQTNDLVRPSCRPTALQVVQVCGRWREIGLETPSLWSSIHIALKHWKDKAGSLTVLTKLFMERSKKSPLDLALEFYADGVAESDTSEYSLLPVIAALSRNCVRWRSITLRIPKPFTQQKLFFNGVHGQTLPSLQELRLIGTGKSNTGNGFPDKLPGLFTHCPSLHTLDINYRFTNNRLALPRHQIKTLSIQRSHTRRAISSVALHPHLQNLALSRVGGDRDNQPYSGHVVSDTVKTLSALFEAQRDVATLSHMTLPALTSLTMEAVPEKLSLWKVWDDSTISDLLARSRCPLITLSIKWIPISDHQFISLLEQIPTLTSLRIEEMSGATTHRIVTRTFLRRLVVDHEDASFQSGGTFLPSLTDLTMVVRAQGLVKQEIFDAVSSRQIPDPLHAREVGVECCSAFNEVFGMF